MDCSCVYSGYDNEPSEFYSEINPVARVIHKCGECAGDIFPDESYKRITGKWDGQFISHKICSDCIAITDAFFCEGYAFGMVFEDLHTHIQEHQGQISEKCLAALPSGAREMVCGMIEEEWRDESSL